MSVIRSRAISVAGLLYDTTFGRYIKITFDLYTLLQITVSSHYNYNLYIFYNNENLAFLVKTA